MRMLRAGIDTRWTSEPVSAPSQPSQLRFEDRQVDLAPQSSPEGGPDGLDPPRRNWARKRPSVLDSRYPPCTIRRRFTIGRGGAAYHVPLGYETSLLTCAECGPRCSADPDHRGLGHGWLQSRLQLLGLGGWSANLPE